MDTRNIILSEIKKTQDVFVKIYNDEPLVTAIGKISDITATALKSGNKIMFCGNGGSAADCQHLAAELVGKFDRDRLALPAIALTTDTSALTAIGNDYGFQYIFSRQIEAIGQKGDILVVASTSGRSQNIVEAVEAAKKKGIITVGFLGEDGRTVGVMVDYQINIPSNLTPKIQEGHIAIGHIFCKLIEQKIFADVKYEGSV
jgi:D-sedoheptulose 7-phosphate isomerase